MSCSIWRGVWISGLVMAVALGGCSGRVPPVKAVPGMNCMGFADDLKTLHPGDELPRVLQVLGTPKTSYRAHTLFGYPYDILEYEISDGDCAQALLHTEKTKRNDRYKMYRVVFDSQGRYIGDNKSFWFSVKEAGQFGQEKLLVDPVVYQP